MERRLHRRSVQSLVNYVLEPSQRSNEDGSISAVWPRRGLRLGPVLLKISRKTWDLNWVLTEGLKGCSTPVSHPASYLYRY